MQYIMQILILNTFIFYVSACPTNLSACLSTTILAPKNKKTQYEE